MILFIDGNKKAEVLKVLYDYAKHCILAETNVRGLRLTIQEAEAFLANNDDIAQLHGIPLNIIFYSEPDQVDVSGFERIYGTDIVETMLENNDLLALPVLKRSNSSVSTHPANILESIFKNYEKITSIKRTATTYVIEASDRKTIILLAQYLSQINNESNHSHLKISIQKNHFFPKISCLEILLSEQLAKLLIPQTDADNAISTYKPTMA